MPEQTPLLPTAILFHYIQNGNSMILTTSKEKEKKTTPTQSSSVNVLMVTVKVTPKYLLFHPNKTLVQWFYL